MGIILVADARDNEVFVGWLLGVEAEELCSKDKVWSGGDDNDWDVGLSRENSKSVVDGSFLHELPEVQLSPCKLPSSNILCVGNPFPSVWNGSVDGILVALENFFLTEEI